MSMNLPRHSALVRITHWVTAASFVGLLVSGIAILVAHPRFYWGETGAVDTPSLVDLPLPFVFGHSGWGRYLHFLSAWICVVTGVTYVTVGFFRRHFTKEFTAYNVVQRNVYRLVIFIYLPMMVWTGFAMSPAITSVFPVLGRALGGQQSARTIHFIVATLLVLFVVGHVVMVFITGFKGLVGPMIEARDLITRRKLIATGLTASGFIVAGKIGARYDLIPPDYSGVFGAGETLTYASQRLLMLRHPLAREFSRSEISEVIPVNGPPPENEAYRRLFAADFADWRLEVDGLVARPSSFSLDELKRFPSRTQITHQACEEGWSFIAEWTGVPLSYVLNLVGVRPEAKYVVFFPFDDSWDSLDMPDAFHPQTLLAYNMNGEPLPTPHGAPVRLRVARQLGYKSVKYLRRITVTDDLRKFGKGLGSYSPEIGYSWYAGI